MANPNDVIHSSARLVHSCAVGMVVAVALSACSSMQASPAPKPAPTASSEKLPDEALDPRVFGQLVLSEIAAQRGYVESAATSELELAQATRDPRLARRAAELAVSAGKPEVAISAAKLWLELSPDSTAALDANITILALSNHLADAEPLMQRSVALAPNPSVTYLRLGSVLARVQDPQLAVATMQHLSAAKPDVATGHLAVAELAQRANQSALAMEEAQAAAHLAPDDEMAVVVAAQLTQSSSPEKAESLLTAFLRRKPDSAKVRTAYARFLVGQRRLDDSRAQFELLAKAHPDNAETLYALGLLAFQSDDRVAARGYFQRFIDIRSKNDDPSGEAELPTDGAPGRSIDQAYLYLAQIDEQQHDYPAALHDLDQISDGAQKRAAEIEKAAIIGRWKGTDAGLSALAAIQTRDDAEAQQLVLARTQLLREGDRPQQAMQVIDDALKLHPDSADLLYEKGMIAEKLNRMDVMEQAMRRLIALKPDNAQGYNALGYSLADRNIRLDEAKALIQKAMSLEPDDASILDSLGWVDYRLGKYDLAVEELKKAYAARGDAEIATHLGEVLWVAGQHAEAEKYWGQASQKEPNNEVLRQTLLRFKVNISAR